MVCLVADDVGEGYFSVRPLTKTVGKRTENIEGSGGKAPSRGLYGLASRSMQRSFRGLAEALDGSFPIPLRRHVVLFIAMTPPRLSRNNIIT